MKTYTVRIDEQQRCLLIDALETQLTAGRADATWLLMQELNDLEEDEAANPGTIHDLKGTA